MSFSILFNQFEHSDYHVQIISEHPENVFEILGLQNYGHSVMKLLMPVLPIEHFIQGDISVLVFKEFLEILISFQCIAFQCFEFLFESYSFLLPYLKILNHSFHNIQLQTSILHSAHLTLSYHIISKVSINKWMCIVSGMRLVYKYMQVWQLCAANNTTMT